MTNNLECIKKRILVVSDNPELTFFFQNECKKQNLECIAEVEYSYSVNNRYPSQMISLGANKVNVKDIHFRKEAKDKYSLIISIHCKQIFPKELVESVICVNFHPGLNPYNRGWYPQVFSIVNKLPLGATLHLMDSEVDHGLIIAQKEVIVKSSDTSLNVYRQVISAEKHLIEQNLISLVNQSYETISPITEGNYNSISSFKELCKLDMDSIKPLREHIDLLRALTHGEHKNAYFLDGNQKKVYITINFQVSE